MQYKTKSIQQAAAILAQTEFPTEYAGLQPTVRQDRVEFIIEVMTEENIFQEWMYRYINQKVCVEPKTFHQALNSIKDNLGLNRR
jgi:hypothetical protein